MSSGPSPDSDAYDATAVVAAVRAQFDAMLSKDVPRIRRSFLHDDRLLTFLEGPIDRLEGVDEITDEEMWRAVESFTELILEDVRSGRDHDLGWVAGTIRTTFVAPDGGEPITGVLRGSWVLQRAEGEWRVLHAHFSVPSPDPYA